MTQIRIQYTPPAPEQEPGERVTPLTHHEILSLMAPFTERGRHADLAASARHERRLAFQPVQHAPTEAVPILRTERLILEAPEPGELRLVRTLTDAGGLVSTLTAKGHDAATLLAWIDAVPIERQFRVHEGVPVARSYQIESTAGAQGGSARVTITAAQARLAGVHIEMKADCFVHHTVEVRITSDPGTRLLIPEDLIAVVGWKWRPLREFVDFWRGSIRVAAKEPRRTADIEAKLGRTITHLARTLRLPPADFHERHRRARWRVTVQRALPLTVGLLILALTPAVQWLDLDDGSILRMLIFHAPPIMLVGIFLLREQPRIEIPPLPRPLRQTVWLTQVTDQGKASRRTTTPTEATET